MKTPMYVCLNIVALIFSLQVKAAAAPTDRDVTVPINNVFIPGGFDSTSDSYVILSGLFANGCYKWKGVVRKDVSKFEHELTSVATVSQGMCIQVLVPFTKDVRLGQLDSGSHTLRFMSNDGTYLEKTLQIE